MPFTQIPSRTLARHKGNSTYLSRPNQTRYRLRRGVAILRERTRLERLTAREANNITASGVTTGNPNAIPQHTTGGIHSTWTHHRGRTRGRTPSVSRRAQLNQADNTSGQRSSRGSPTQKRHRMQYDTTYAAQLFSKIAWPSSSAAAVAGVTDSTPTAMASSRLHVPVDALPIAAGMIATGTARQVAVAVPFCGQPAPRNPPSPAGAALAKAGTKWVPNAIVDGR